MIRKGLIILAVLVGTFFPLLVASPAFAQTSFGPCHTSNERLGKAAPGLEFKMTVACTNTKKFSLNMEIERFSGGVWHLVASDNHTNIPSSLGTEYTVSGLCECPGTFRWTWNAIGFRKSNNTLFSGSATGGAQIIT